jgi:DNA mismatch endonuclease (patch repair protein)
VPDSLSPAKRSANMAAIHSSNTVPEVLLRKALFRQGFRYRITAKKLPGRPDIVFPRYHAVIFVHGCFWHGHWCPKYRLPKSNGHYWAEKIHRNKIRDHDALEKLLDAGWRVAIVWECVIKGPKRENRLASTIDQIVVWIKGTDSELEIPTPFHSSTVGSEPVVP